MTAPIPRPGILDISMYVAGDSTLPGFENPTKLSSNESALGPSARAIEAYKAALSGLALYPDGHATLLREALAELHGIDARRIVCGVGSDELLMLLAIAYAGPDDEVLYSEHAFTLYPIVARTVGAKPVAAPESALTASVDNLLAKVTERTRLLYLANPNNPTGTYLPNSELYRLRKGLPERVILVIDSAYAEFVSRNDYTAGIDMVESHDNVVMTRTFSKIYALAGLRLGWAYCPATIADVLNRIRGPHNISGPAILAGVAAVKDQPMIELARNHNEYWRAWLTEELTRLGIEIVPSVTNFVLARFGSVERAQAADAHLRANGIIVRRAAGYGLPDSLRITIGKAEAMTAVRDALAAFAQGKEGGKS
jgi:histidinol-phosphate aminotransferase